MSIFYALIPAALALVFRIGIWRFRRSQQRRDRERLRRAFLREHPWVPLYLEIETALCQPHGHIRPPRRLHPRKPHGRRVKPRPAPRSRKHPHPEERSDYL